MTALDATRRSTDAGAALFARFAYPPNELGYCGPEDTSSTIAHINGAAPAHTHDWARTFDGAWPYLEALAEAAGTTNPLETCVVRTYWIGGELLSAIDQTRLLNRLRQRFHGQTNNLLDAVTGAVAHHSFHVLTVYPWSAMLGMGPVPLSVLQSCRIRWGTVTAVGADDVTVRARPLMYDGTLYLANEVHETARWRSAATQLTSVHVGDTVALHWDWVCDVLDTREAADLEQAQHTTLALINSAL